MSVAVFAFANGADLVQHLTKMIFEIGERALQHQQLADIGVVFVRWQALLNASDFLVHRFEAALDAVD
jgi:uncharacterized membrane protein (Fun14 family)